MTHCLFPYRVRTASIAVFLLAVTGCGAGGDTVSVDSNNDENSSARSLSTASLTALTEKVKFKRGDGQEAYSLKPESDGAKLVNATQNEIARYSFGDAKLKVKGPDEAVIGYIVSGSEGLKIKDARQEKTLFKLQEQPDGDWKLEDGANQLVYKIKRRDYGFEIEAPENKSLLKVKLKDGKLSVRDSAEKTILYTKDEIPTISMVCFGLDALDSEPLRFGLMTMLILERSR